MHGQPPVQCEISFDPNKGHHPLSASLELPRFHETNKIIPGSIEDFRELALQTGLVGRVEVALPKESQHGDNFILTYENFYPYDYDPHDAWENPSTLLPHEMLIFTPNPYPYYKNIPVRFHFYPSGKLTRELQMYVDKSE